MGLGLDEGFAFAQPTGHLILFIWEGAECGCHQAKIAIKIIGKVVILWEFFLLDSMKRSHPCDQGTPKNYSRCLNNGASRASLLVKNIWTLIFIWCRCSPAIERARGGSPALAVRHLHLAVAFDKTRRAARRTSPPEIKKNQTYLILTKNMKQ